jgi:hypothetical protein
MKSASHVLITPPAGPASERPRSSPRTVLAELGDVLWLSYYHLVDQWHRTRFDGFVSRPVHAIDLATLDGHRLTVPARQDRGEVRVLHLDGHLPGRPC